MYKHNLINKPDPSKSASALNKDIFPITPPTKKDRKLECWLWLLKIKYTHLNATAVEQNNFRKGDGNQKRTSCEK